MGDTTVEGSQQELKAKQDEIDKLNAAVEKEKKRVENAEKKFSEWGNELGEIRKDRETLKETLTEAQKTIADLKLAIDSKANIAPKGNEEEGDKGGKPPETPEEIESALTPEQKKEGEVAFNVLSKEEKIQYDNDPKFKVAFFKRLQTTAPVVPLSPWTTAKAAERKGKTGIDSILDRVFEKKNRASFVPEGPRGKAPPLTNDFEKDEKDYQEDDRVH